MLLDTHTCQSVSNPLWIRPWLLKIPSVYNNNLNKISTIMRFIKRVKKTLKLLTQLKSVIQNTLCFSLSKQSLQIEGTD